MQGATEFHYQLTDARLPQAAPVFDEATALDTAVARLNPQPTVGQRLVGHGLLQRQRLAAGWLRRQAELHLGQRARQAAHSRPPPAPSREGLRGRLGAALLRDTAAPGGPEQEDREQGLHEQDLVDGMVLWLAARTRGLCSRGLGADAAPGRPVMGTRGAAASGGTTGAASASETPQRCARAPRERGGIAEGVARCPQRGQEDVEPRIGLTLPPPEEASLPHLEGQRLSGT